MRAKRIPISIMKNFWLVKQEPSSYSWSDFTTEGETDWTGVRNYTARNNLRRMRRGDEVLFYHSGSPAEENSACAPIAPLRHAGDGRRVSCDCSYGSVASLPFLRLSLGRA